MRDAYHTFSKELASKPKGDRRERSIRRLQNRLAHRKASSVFFLVHYEYYARFFFFEFYFFRDSHFFMFAYALEHDTLLLDLVEQHGTRWKVVRDEFNRLVKTRQVFTIHMIRNRFARMTKQKLAGRNLCASCGQLKRGHTCGALRYNAIRVKLRGSIVTDTNAPPPKIPETFPKLQEIIEEYENMHANKSLRPVFGELQWS